MTHGGGKIGRRAVLLASLGASLGGPVRAASPLIRVGILRFGTVAWELDVLRTHGLDVAAGIAVEAVEFASSQATQVALQAARVDTIVSDWLWVARQRASGADWTMSPTSGAVGAVLVPPNSPVHDLADLAGKRLGVAGSPLDKSWLLLRAYARKRLGHDLDGWLTTSFGPPPLLSEQLAAGQLDAVLTFWPFAARAEAAGMRRLLSVEDVVRGLGIDTEVPFVGFVFAEKWGREHRPAIDAFLAASGQARTILGNSDAEWTRIAGMTKAADAAELQQLKTWYRSGRLQHWGPAEQEAVGHLYQVLAEIGGPALVGQAATLPPGTFWEQG